LEDAGIDFDFFDTGTVEFFEGGYDAGLFASAGGPVDQEVWEVARLCLDGGKWWGLKGERMGNSRESGDDQRGHDGRTVDRGTVDGVYLRGAPWRVVVVSRFSGENWRMRERKTR
jgi:hypothetical protein